MANTQSNLLKQNAAKATKGSNKSTATATAKDTAIGNTPPPPTARAPLTPVDENTPPTPAPANAAQKAKAAKAASAAQRLKDAELREAALAQALRRLSSTRCRAGSGAGKRAQQRRSLDR